MTVTYLPKGAEHTDNETVLKNVISIVQNRDEVRVEYGEGVHVFHCFIENGIEFHVMPEDIK